MSHLVSFPSLGPARLLCWLWRQSGDPLPGTPEGHSGSAQPALPPETRRLALWEPPDRVPPPCLIAGGRALLCIPFWLTVWGTWWAGLLNAPPGPALVKRLLAGTPRRLVGVHHRADRFHLLSAPSDALLSPPCGVALTCAPRRPGPSARLPPVKPTGVCPGVLGKPPLPPPPRPQDASCWRFLDNVSSEPVRLCLASWKGPLLGSACVPAAVLLCGQRLPARRLGVRRRCHGPRHWEGSQSPAGGPGLAPACGLAL